MMIVADKLTSGLIIKLKMKENVCIGSSVFLNEIALEYKIELHQHKRKKHS